VRFVVGVQPIQKQSDDVIISNSRASRICDQLHEQPTFFVSVRLIPLPKRFANQREILLTG